MLTITIPATTLWDERREKFVKTKAQTLQLEHSLVSLSKWESKWCKAFLGKSEKTEEEILDYIKCMTITQNVDPEVYNSLTDDNLRRINKYIEAPMTATRFPKSENSKTSREVATSELIYYWMIASNIPFECQKWHLNRLLTLIRVCQLKNQPKKKRGSSRTAATDYAAMNAARRKKLGTRG